METRDKDEPAGGGLVLAIAGIGLIGGSIAAAVRARGLAAEILGIGRSPERLERARQAGLIDEFATDYRLLRRADLFVSCLPVDCIAESIRRAAAEMPAGSIATDAGSVKGRLCAAIGPAPSETTVYVGSHPLAGSQRSGFQFADPDLFDGRTCVLTPTGQEPREAIDRLESFWESLGANVVTLPADEHDKILARTSHLPHVAAAALVRNLGEGDLPLAAGGFRDTTRIAAGDPRLWSAILLANRPAVESSLDALIAQCRQFREALSEGDRQQLESLLAEAKHRRDQFSDQTR